MFFSIVAVPISSSSTTMGLQPSARHRVGTYQGLTEWNGHKSKLLPCLPKSASRSQRRSVCQSWDWGCTVPHTMPWEAWESPANREQTCEHLSPTHRSLHNLRNIPGGRVLMNSLSFQGELKMEAALSPKDYQKDHTIWYFSMNF